MSKILHKNSNACDDALALFVGLRCWLAAAAGRTGWIFLNNGHRHIPIGASFGINIRHAACASASFNPCAAASGRLTCRRCIFPRPLLRQTVSRHLRSSFYAHHVQSVPIRSTGDRCSCRRECGRLVGKRHRCCRRRP